MAFRMASDKYNYATEKILHNFLLDNVFLSFTISKTFAIEMAWPLF